MEPVSSTAQWTAAIRALESERETGALFADPLARRLAEPDGFSLIERYRGGGVRDFVTIRTRYVDDACAAILAGRPDLRQVAIVAAGMDTRAFRLPWVEGTRVFEIDHAALLEEKERRLSEVGAAARAQRVPVPADLARGWGRRRSSRPGSIRARRRSSSSRGCSSSLPRSRRAACSRPADR